MRYFLVMLLVLFTFSRLFSSDLNCNSDIDSPQVKSQFVLDTSFIEFTGIDKYGYEIYLDFDTSAKWERVTLRITGYFDLKNNSDSDLRINFIHCRSSNFCPMFDIHGVIIPSHGSVKVRYNIYAGVYNHFVEEYKDSIMGTITCEDMKVFFSKVFKHKRCDEIKISYFTRKNFHDCRYYYGKLIGIKYYFQINDVNEIILNDKIICKKEIK